MKDWAREILSRVDAVADLVDRGEPVGSYREAVREMSARIENPELTPSARLLLELREADTSFFEFALEVARGHKRYFANITPLPEERLRELEQEAETSILRQREIEDADDISFEDYLANYFASD